jgi:hypothetical protein
MVSETPNVLSEQPRPAERRAECKTFCHYTEPVLKLARGGQSSLCVHGGALFMSRAPVVMESDLCGLWGGEPYNEHTCVHVQLDKFPRSLV